MKQRLVISALATLALLGVPASAQETPESIVTAYEALADTILAVRAAEHSFVRALLDGHLHAAEVRFRQGNWESAAAEMSLFANEGDNAIGGVRKRLLEGGHHFNAEGEEQGVFEPGYVVVTVEAKQALLAASAALRQATDVDARQSAWDEFSSTAQDLLAAD